jgi:hypothetical protein
VIVGGGPNGVEFAGELRGNALPTLTLLLSVLLFSFVDFFGNFSRQKLIFYVDFVHENLTKTFPKLVPKVNITLLELLDHILNMYDRKISECKKTYFRVTCNALPRYRKTF